MSSIIVGVDPGIVHTGIVRVVFDPGQWTITRGCLVVDGLDAEQVQEAAFGADLVVVEKYVPRSNFGQDPDMLKAEGEIKRLLPKAVLLDNMGIKNVVLQPLMETLGLWDFPLRTHHQDLRSAARIMLLGMLRNDEYNLLLSDIVFDHLEGRSWVIREWNY